VVVVVVVAQSEQVHPVDRLLLYRRPAHDKCHHWLHVVHRTEPLAALREHAGHGQTGPGLG